MAKHLLHSLQNLIAISLILTLPFLNKSRAEVGSLSNWVPEILLTVAFVPLLILFWRRFRPTA